MKKAKIEHFELNKDFNPNIIKTLSYSELSVLSADVRKLIVEKCSEFGGHLASNLGVVELTIALHKHFNFPKDKLLFDVGHQCYTHKILTGRPLDNLRKENGISGFQKMNESEYDSFEAGHSSTSISTAIGMAITRDLENENYDIVSVIGDSSISNGMAFEALNHLGSLPNKVIIILNDNQMSIGKPVGGTHLMLQKIRMSKKYQKTKARYREIMLKHKFTTAIYNFSSFIKTKIFKKYFYTNLFENLGLYYIGKVDGHDFKSMEKAIKLAKKASKSVVIHVSTIKGKGYEPAEKDQYGFYHGIGPFDIETGKQLKETPKDQASWSKVYARLLENVMNESNKSTIIHPATGFGSHLNRVTSTFPNRSFDVGIAEEHAITLASGMSLNDYHPYVVVYSSFLQRAYDQINHDLARMNLKATLLIDRAGLVGSDGETHQGIFDSSFLINMPNTSVAMAKNQEEAARLMKFSINYNHLLAIRYPKSETDYIKLADLNNVEPFKLGEWLIEQDSSNDVCLISYGPLLNNLIEKLKNTKIKIINAVFQKPLNANILNELTSYENVIIYDPYGIEEGFCYHVEAELRRLGFKGNIRTFGIKNEFITCGTIEQQLKRQNLDIDSIIEEINKII